MNGRWFWQVIHVRGIKRAGIKIQRRMYNNGVNGAGITWGFYTSGPAEKYRLKFIFHLSTKTNG